MTDTQHTPPLDNKATISLRQHGQFSTGFGCVPPTLIQFNQENCEISAMKRLIDSALQKRTNPANTIEFFVHELEAIAQYPACSDQVRDVLCEGLDAGEQTAEEFALIISNNDDFYAEQITTIFTDRDDPSGTSLVIVLPHTAS